MGPESERKIFKAAVVNTDELVMAQARDIADARMTESKEDRSGGRVKRYVDRMWKHNYAQQFYRQREVNRVRDQINKTGDFYQGEEIMNPDQQRAHYHDWADPEEIANSSSRIATNEMNNAIVERFTSDYAADMLEEEEIDSKELIENEMINTGIKDLMKLYASTEMEDDAFEEEKKRILAHHDKKIVSGKNMYTDNLLTIAKEVRGAFGHHDSLAEIDFDVQVTLGNARETLSTQSHLQWFDKCLDSMQQNKLGRWVANQPVALVAVAGLWDAASKGLQKVTRSKAVQIGTFGLAAAAAGGIGAVNEHLRITQERAQNQREKAKGVQFTESDMLRRQELGQSDYITRKADNIISDLRYDLQRAKAGELSEDDLTGTIGQIADLEARLQLNREQQIDLITYDKFNVMEKDRNTMRLTLAELKKELRGHPNAQDFDTKLADFVAVQKQQLVEGEYGIEQKDKIFNKLRKTRTQNAFVTSALMSATIGVAFQEVASLFNGSEDGIIEGTVKHLMHQPEKFTQHATALEALRRSLSGDHVMVPHEASHVETFGDSATKVALPGGVTFTENADQTYNLMRGDEIISSHVPVNFDAHGNFSPETIHALAANGVTGSLGHCTEEITTPVSQPVDDYVRDHANGMQQIARNYWNDNDTKIFDHNELKLQFGGINGTGIDKDGNYVFTIAHMTKGGSFHEGMSTDVPEEVKNGHCKMAFSFSRATEHKVLEVPFDEHGNAVINPNSEVGREMMEKVNGHAVYDGAFAEAVQTKGMEGNVEHVDMLATYEGSGKDMIDTVVTKEISTPNIMLHIPESTIMNLPPIGPVWSRRPSERGTYKSDAVVNAERPDIVKQEDYLVHHDLPETPPVVTLDTTISRGMTYNPLRGGSASFSRKEDPGVLSPEATQVYGFASLNSNEIESQLKNVDRYERPQVFFFENDVTKREQNMNLLKNLEKWPKYNHVRFTYVPLPDGVNKLGMAEMAEYGKKRFDHILEDSAIRSSKRNLHVYNPLGPLSSRELSRFMTEQKVSPERLLDIQKKIDAGEELTQNEDMIHKIMNTPK